MEIKVTKGTLYIALIIFIIAFMGGQAGQKQAEYRAKEKVISEIQRSLDYEKKEPFSLKRFIFG